jgi:DNA helicase-2/ATP-dependent DNA helicase PcrA
VIAMTADFLGGKRGLRRQLVTRFPILLVDESQDTSRKLMDVLLDVEAAHRDTFCLGLIGDTMQRIYADGKDRLAEAIPEIWARPRKRMNHRCPTRVIALINMIRHDEDREEQVPRSDASAGVVRLFVVPQATVDKMAIESAIAAKMGEITGDPSWGAGSTAIKTLALEHLMSARRFGFEAFFAPLYAVERIRTSFLDGTGAGVGLFTREILPLVTALRASDRFAAAAVVRHTSPLLERKALEEAGDRQAEILGKAKTACDGLLALVSGDEPPTARTVLRYVAERRARRWPRAPTTSPATGSRAGRAARWCSPATCWRHYGTGSCRRPFGRLPARPGSATSPLPKVTRSPASTAAASIWPPAATP